MKMKPYFSVLILWLLFPALSLAAESPVGSIKTIEGDVIVLRGGQSLHANIGMPIFQGDIIQTPPSGSVGIIFRDDSIISMGPESKIDITEYVFEPRDEKFSMFIKMIKGTFVYISGAIGRLSPDAIKLETPSSIIAVRGTKMLIEVKG
jgi:hypothetical protein